MKISFQKKKKSWFLMLISCNDILILECKKQFIMQLFILFRKYHIHKNKWALSKPLFLHFYKLYINFLEQTKTKKARKTCNILKALKFMWLFFWQLMLLWLVIPLVRVVLNNIISPMCCELKKKELYWNQHQCKQIRNFGSFNCIMVCRGIIYYKEREEKQTYCQPKNMNMRT